MRAGENPNGRVFPAAHLVRIVGGQDAVGVDRAAEANLVWRLIHVLRPETKRSQEKGIQGHATPWLRLHGPGPCSLGRCDPAQCRRWRPAGDYVHHRSSRNPRLP